VFTIGIGDGCSEALVKGAAKAGAGKAIFIKDSDDVQGKIIRLLEKALTPSITNFSFEFDKNVVAAISPMPAYFSHILANEPFTCFVLLKDELES
jgi:hypothetical protein